MERKHSCAFVSQRSKLVARQSTGCMANEQTGEIETLKLCKRFCDRPDRLIGRGDQDEVGRRGNDRDVIRAIPARNQRSAFLRRAVASADDRDGPVAGTVQHARQRRANLPGADQAYVEASLSRLHLIHLRREPRRFVREHRGEISNDSTSIPCDVAGVAIVNNAG